MLSGGRRWSRQANVNGPASGSGPLITAGWHTLARVWDGREVRQYVDGLRNQHHCGDRDRQLAALPLRLSVHRQRALDEAYVPFFGAFGATWDDAMVVRWGANPLGMLWPDMDAAFVTSGGVPPAAARRPVVVIAVG
jgi:hypothetical protein